jgi:hypothetical protein
MDGERFDAWTKRQAERRSRRAVLAAAVGGIFGAIGLSGPAGADNLCKPAGKKCNKDAQCCSGLVCRGGACVDLCAGVNCDDGNACTQDVCTPDIGCAHIPIECNSGSLCVIDTCDPDIGCVSVEKDCDDGNPCTIDTCDPETGCVHTLKDCDDFNADTLDYCDENTGECVHEIIDNG